MFTGYFICVLLNCGTIFSWKFLPLSIYFSIPPVIPLAYSLVSKAVSLTGSVHEISQYIIKTKWPKEIFVLNKSGKLSNFTLKHLRKEIKALRPVAFYSAEVCMLTNDIKMQYYGRIWSSTVDAFLLFKAKIKSISFRLNL